MHCASIDSLTHFNWRCACVHVYAVGPTAKWFIPWKIHQENIEQKHSRKNSIFFWHTVKSNSPSFRFRILLYIHYHYHYQNPLEDLFASKTELKIKILFYSLQRATTAFTITHWLTISASENRLFDKLFDLFVRQATGFVSMKMKMKTKKKKQKKIMRNARDDNTWNANE